MNLNLEFRFLKATEILRSCQRLHKLVFAGDGTKLFHDCKTVSGNEKVLSRISSNPVGSVRVDVSPRLFSCRLLCVWTIGLVWCGLLVRLSAIR